jgi:anti-sigma factor RsiW
VFCLLTDLRYTETKGCGTKKGPTTSMTCREFVDFLMEYLSGELSARERAEFGWHLAECPDCSTYLQSYQETIKLGKAVFADPDAPVPLGVPEELVQAILASRR